MSHSTEEHSPEQLIADAVRAGAFPWARAEVWSHGNLHGAFGEGPEEGLFDLASLTKVMCTGALFISMWAKHQVTPETPLADFFPKTPLVGVTLEDLLLHRSGLPAFRPFFAHAIRRWPELLDSRCPPSIRQAARLQLVDDVFQTPPEAPRATHLVYSDLGFILLGEVLSRIGGASLDVLYQTHVAKPLGLGARFRPLDAPREDEEPPIAPTGGRRPREPAPKQANEWSDIPAAVSAVGEVDDDNAWAMGGVAGHAGLFGSASDVARFGVRVLEELAGKHRLAPLALWNRMVTRDALTPGSTRTLAFELPSATHSSTGHILGDKPPGAIGHLGFTGTSVWIDRARQVVVALCTNRVANGRAVNPMLAFRPRFHDGVMRSLGFHAAGTTK